MAVVVAALGNPGVLDAARGEGSFLATSVTAFASWDVAEAPGDVVGLVALRLGLTVAAAGLLSAVGGRGRSRPAAWLAGWGAVVVAAALAAAAAYVYQVAVVLDGRSFAATYADGLVQSANGGAAFGLWTGWLVGLAVAMATPREPRRAVAPPWVPPPVPAGAVPGPGPGPAETTAGGFAADTPPPWWAPTAGSAGEAVRPGPTAYPPGGLAPPVLAAGEPAPPVPPPSPAAPVTTTAPGTAHPSDPEATRAVGLPPPAEVTEPAGPPATAPVAQPPSATEDALVTEATEPVPDHRGDDVRPAEG
ncbi:MAG TPA: hypothetical protein VFW63_08495 [Acidimicrobiales bacterium]|nr:hypothetical protein [Acidimicrobiales bacterium]